jgi:hypothetical protein
MNFKEMLLVPKGEFEKFNLKPQNELEKEMKKLKNNNVMSKHEKKIRFKNQLNDYFNSVETLREPMKISVHKEVRVAPKKNLKMIL